MSKWDKPAKPLTQQFLQNEQRRRQMIIEASKRRRQKQKKLQQLNENLKKNEQQTLQRIKKQKQQAYNKYLKNNNNMHDKYEQMKRNQKMQEEPKAVKEVSKWKKRQGSQGKGLEALDLERSHGKSVGEEAKSEGKNGTDKKKGTQGKKVVVQEFQKQWAEQQPSPQPQPHPSQQPKQQMLGSKLLDSLDLDLDTMQRGRQINSKLEKIKKLAGDKPNINKNQVDEIKNLIGYDSMLVSYDQCTEMGRGRETMSSKNVGMGKPVVVMDRKNKSKQKEKEKEKQKEINEQQTFNNLKHKKQGKILDWANTKVQQADDLFSNCSSNKNIANKSVGTNAKQKENKGSKKSLDPIPQRVNNKSVEKEKRSSEKVPVQSVQGQRKGHILVRANRSSQKIQPENQKRKGNKSSEQKQKVSQKEVKTPQINDPRTRSISKQKSKAQQALFQKDRQRSLQKIKQRRPSKDRTTSAEKPRTQPQPLPQIPKTQQPFRQSAVPKNPPPIPKPSYTVATHEQYFDVESFIKNDLVQINEEELRLQEEIRDLHVNNKDKIRDVERKYQIRTDYKNSANLIKRQQNQDDGAIGSYATHYTTNQQPINEDLIQDSIQRLDDLLIKKQIKQRQKTHITEESHIKSIINPFSKPEDLHKQILQLAENISKFENAQGPPGQQVKGYGYQRKVRNRQASKQKQKKHEIPQEISISRNYDQPPKKPQQNNKKNLLKMPNPPILSYSNKNSEIVEVNMEEQYFDPEDSLETMRQDQNKDKQKDRDGEKIQVNEKLRGILFD